MNKITIKFGTKLKPIQNGCKSQLYKIARTYTSSFKSTNIAHLVLLYHFLVNARKHWNRKRHYNSNEPIAAVLRPITTVLKCRYCPLFFFFFFFFFFCSVQYVSSTSSKFTIFSCSFILILFSSHFFLAFLLRFITIIAKIKIII